MYKHLILIILTLLVMACSQPSDNAPKIAADQRAVLEKAKEVDGKLQESAEQTKQAIDAEN